MEVVFPRCAGLDVHKKTVVACVSIHEGSERIREVRTFGTTTAQLHALRAWLREMRVAQVAMESTGSYWKPVFNLLEEDGTPWVVNPAHIKQVPGRKTDVKDAEWMADLLQHGLLMLSLMMYDVLIPTFSDADELREWAAAAAHSQDFGYSR